MEIDPAQEPLSGLTKKCCASCFNILTRDQTVIGPIIGYLSVGIMQQIEDCLKKVLEIP